MNVRKGALAAALAATVTLTGASLSSASAHSSAPDTEAKGSSARVNLDLTPSSPALAACFPHAAADVSVKLRTAKDGWDDFRIDASGLKPNTEFTIFLLEKARAPFGAAEYIGDITTDGNGQAHNKLLVIVEEAFAFNNVTGSRTDLNSIGIWFADPADDDDCLGAGGKPTGFDGDGEAGVQMLNSGDQLLP